MAKLPPSDPLLRPKPPPPFFNSGPATGKVVCEPYIIGVYAHIAGAIRSAATPAANVTLMVLLRLSFFNSLIVIKTAVDSRLKPQTTGII